MKRRHSLKIYNGLYHRLPLENDLDMDRCFYCGEPATCKDHQPPITQFADMVDAGYEFEACFIPSCNHCNSLLSDTPTKTVSERFQLLKQRVERKYKKHIRAATAWRLEDTVDLGDSLRGMVLASIETGTYAKSILAYPGHRLKDLNLWTSEENVIQCPSCGTFHDLSKCPSCGVSSDADVS